MHNKICHDSFFNNYVYRTGFYKFFKAKFNDTLHFIFLCIFTCFKAYTIFTRTQINTNLEIVKYRYTYFQMQEKSFYSETQHVSAYLTPFSRVTYKVRYKLSHGRRNWGVGGGWGKGPPIIWLRGSGPLNTE